MRKQRNLLTALFKSRAEFRGSQTPVCGEAGGCMGVPMPDKYEYKHYE